MTDAEGHEVGASGFVCRSSLLTFFGLTPKWADRLNPPDKVVPNPHYKSAAPMRLYSVERVEGLLAQWSSDPAFVKMREGRARRKEAAARGVASRTEAAEQQLDALLDWARTVPVQVNVPGVELLRKRIRKARGRMIAPPSGEGVEWEVLNCIRHEFSSYHALLADLEERVRKLARVLREQADYKAYKAYEIIKARVNASAKAALAEQGIEVAS
jgi:hypothetical protein